MTIQQTWQLFKAENAIVEVRALDCAGKHKSWHGWASGIVSGYFDDDEAFVDAVTALDKSRLARSIYITMNPVQPDLLARANNRLLGLQRQSPTTDDTNILARRWLLLDFDPVRPTGISSTAAELKLAAECAKAARSALSQRGWPNPVSALSGNGIHLLYRIAQPCTEDSTELLRGTLYTLRDEFSSEQVQLDTTVFNASRVTKLYGTLTRKGDSTPERPHRRSSILKLTDL